MDEPTYESILIEIGGIRPPANPDARAVRWIPEGSPVGVGRRWDGSLEIFLLGSTLIAQIPAVAQAMSAGEWYREDGTAFEANRIALPRFAHFDQVAAFITTELLRQGGETDPARALATSEPIIALALDPLRQRHQQLMGLAGELMVIRALVLSTQAPGAVLEAWAGSGRSARDIQLGTLGLEVKATEGDISSHEISGTWQTEIGHPVGSTPETALWLVSLGLRTGIMGDETWSIRGLLDEITDRAMTVGAPDSAVSGFRDQVGRYGGAQFSDHDLDFRFSLSFARAYDMTDAALQVLRTADVRARPNVETDSVRFRVNLPERVTGDVNPIVGLPRIAKEACRIGGLA